MTTDQIQINEAIELAHDTLEKRSSTWHDRGVSGQWEAELWESVLVSDTLFGGPIIEGGQTRFVLKMPPKSEDAPDSYEMYSDEKGAKLIDRAVNGDSAAKNVLCGIAADYLERGRELPDNLRGFAVVTLRALGNVQSSRRGRNPYANHARNLDVACTILKVMSLGFKPVRRQSFWDIERFNLREALARLVGDVTRPADDAASVDWRWSVV